MSDQETVVKLGVVFTPLQAGMTQAVAAVQNGVGAMKSNLDGLKSSVATITSTFAGLAAVVAGGALFKGAMDSTTAWTGEVSKLSKVLGVSTEEASTYGVALKLIGKSADDFADAAFKLLRQIKANEEGVNDLGLSTRDAEGHLRPMTELLKDSVSVLMQYKEGADRDAASMDLFGRSAQEVLGLFKLNESVMARAKQMAEEYGLVVGPEGAAKMKAYNMELAATKILVEAMAEKVGQTAMPELRRLAGWFAEVGPEAIRFTSFALKNLIQFFEETALIVREVWENVASFFEVVTGQIAKVVAATAILVTQGPTAAAAAWDQANEEIQAGIEQRAKNIEDIERDTNARLKALWADDVDLSVPKADKGGDKRHTGGPPADQLAKWRSELEQQKEAEGSFFRDSLEMEESFWTKRLALTSTKTAKDRELHMAVQHELYQIHKQQAQQELAEDVQDLKLKEEQARANGTDRIRIAGEIAARIGQAYGTESAQYKAALRDMTKAAADRGAELKRIDEDILASQRDHDLAMVDMDAEQLNLRKQLGQIDAAEEIAGIQQLEDRRYQIQLQALQDRLKLLDKESEEYQKVLGEMGKLNDAHNLAVKKSNDSIVVETGKKWDSLFSSVESAMANSAKGIALGTQTLRQAMLGLGDAILGEFTSLGAKMVFAWVKTQAGLTLTSEEGAAQRLAIESWSAIESIAIASWAALKKIAIYAGEAAAGAFKAIVGIPYVGPVLAPAAAAVALGAVLKLGTSIGSAEGGWVVPSDQLAMVHKDEHILPASIARRYNEGAPGSSGGGGRGRSDAGSGDVHVHFNVKAIDSKDVKHFFNNHGHVMAAEIRRQVRDFNSDLNPRT